MEMTDEEKRELEFRRQVNRTLRQDERCEKGEHKGDAGKKCENCGADIPKKEPETPPKPAKKSKWE